MSRKILLILSIVFLLLIPETAFASANMYSSSVVVSNINAEADDAEKVLVSIYLKDKSNNETKDTIYVASSRGSIDTFWTKKNGSWVKVSSLSKDDKLYFITSNVIEATVNGRLELGVSSSVKGDMEVVVGLKGERALSQYISGHLSEKEAEIISVTFSKEEPEEQNIKYNKLNLVLPDEITTYTDNIIKINVNNYKGKIEQLGEEVYSMNFKTQFQEKPKDSNPIIEKPDNLMESLQNGGIAEIIFKTDKEGTYSLKTSLKIKSKNSFCKNISLATETKINIAEKVFGANKITLFLNDSTAIVDSDPRKLDLQPFILHNRTFVPVRFIAEALGAEVFWEAEAQSIILSRPDRKVTMVIGSNVILLSNGEVIMSDVAPFIKEGYTVLPFRKIAEAFGAQVSVGYKGSGEIERIIFENL